MRRALAVLAAPLLGLVQCSPITVPVSTTPLNTCTVVTGCMGADIACESTMSGEACLSTLPLPSYVLVVNVPEGAIYAPGEPLTYTRSSRSDCPSGVAKGTDCAAPCKGSPKDPTCIQLPFLYQASSAYVVLPDTNLSSLLGNPATASTTVPAQASYAPVWAVTPECAAPPCAPVMMEASLVNLPLPTVFAASFTPAPDVSLPSGTSGPEGMVLDTTGWTALLPELFSGYVEWVNLASPFDEAFPALLEPPSESLGQGSLSNTINVSASLLPISPVTTAISPPGVVQGWTVSIQDRATRRVVSSRPVIQRGSVPIRWLSTGVLTGFSTPEVFASPPVQAQSNAYDIVLSPPPGAVGLPELVDLYEGLPEERYPDLPKPTTISGTVRSGAGPISASLHFVSTVLYNISGSSCTVENSFATLLHYDVVVPTSDRVKPGGAVGTYSVVLPQGKYIVTVDPDPTSTLAKETFGSPFAVPPETAISLPMTGACTKTEEGGHDFTLDPRIDVTGMVSIADGRLLAGATVELTPAASLLASPQFAPADWPRPVQVVAGTDGLFRASVDPGTYDVTVRPVEGTRFPWIVSPAHTFSESSTTVPHLYVPAPAPLVVTIHEPLNDSPIAQAVVRAYAFTSCVPQPGESMCTGVALQIGEAFTDTNGSLEMFLTPFPFTSENP